MASREYPTEPLREEHALYVALADKSPAGRQAIEFLGGAAGYLRRQGIAVQVYRVRPRDLRDSRVLEAFRRRGIGRLPAVLARGRPLVGLAEIHAYYAGPSQAPGFASGPRQSPTAGTYAGRGPARARAPAERPGGAPLEGGAPFAFVEAAPSRLDSRGGGPGAAGLADEDGSPEADLEDYFRQEILGGLGGGDDAGFGPA